MVTHSRLPVLWLCGAPAAGKSTVAWQTLTCLSDQGLRVGYVDIDQVGMLYPRAADDPSGHAFKVDNFGGLVGNYCAAGAQALVVSGVIDPESGADVADRAADADLTFCLLTVDEPTLRSRLADRGWSVGAADDALQMMNSLIEAPFVNTIIETTSRTPDSLAREAAALVTPVSSRPAVQQSSRGGAGKVTLIVGPRAVGKSSVSWAMAMRSWSAGARTAYVDLDQLGFLRPEPAGISLRAANLGVIWRNAVARGARRLIANGLVTTHEDLSVLRHAVRPASVHVIRLAADPATLWDRIHARRGGGPARLINDDLEDVTASYQRGVHRDAVAQAASLAAINLGDSIIDTTHLSVGEVIERAL